MPLYNFGSGGGDNFANADLTVDANRTHNMAGYDMKFNLFSSTGQFILSSGQGGYGNFNFIPYSSSSGGVARIDNGLSYIQFRINYGAEVNKLSINKNLNASAPALGVKGTGSTSATTTALFENSAGTDLFKILDDGQGIRNSSNSLITQFNSTALNPYIEINSSGTNNSSLVFSQASSQKYLFGFENGGNFRLRDLTAGLNRFIITSTGSFELSNPSVTTSNFNLGGDMYVDAITQLSATFKGTSNTYINIDNGSTSNASSVGYSANGILKWLTGYEATTGSFRINSQVTTNTPFKIDTSDNIIMANLPTSSVGLPTGALWNNSGVINIA